MNQNTATVTRPATENPRNTTVAQSERKPSERPPKKDDGVSFPLITDEQFEQAERSLANVLKIKRLAFRVTNKNDWNDVGGRPYLNESGCMKVGALFGVSLTGTEVKELRESYEGQDVVRYVAKTTATFLGRQIELEGLSASSEPFFSRKNGQAIPLSEIDLNAVRKKAVTNAHNRAIKKILGLGGITWDEVRDAGVRKDDVSSVEYKRPPARAEPQAVQDSMTRALAAKTRLQNMLTDLASFEKVPFGQVLRHYTTFQGKHGETRSAESVERMTEAWVSKTLERVEPDWRSIPQRRQLPRRASVEG